MSEFRLLCATLSLLSICSVVYGAEGDLCVSDEIMIASCRLDEKQGRVISLCSGGELGTVNYRIGTKSNVELDVAFTRTVPISRWVDVATYTTYFGFKRSGYAYVFGVPQETMGARAFLEVNRQGALGKSYTCIDNSYGEKELKSPAIVEVEDDAVRGGGRFPPD